MRRHGRGITRGARLCAWVLLLALPASSPAAPSGSDSSRATPPISLKLPADLVYDRVVGPARAVVFSHETHFALEGNRCTGCHTGRFRMLAPTHRTSHAEMNAGRSCGACHDGRHAFGVADSTSCGTCHSGRRQVSTAGAAGATGGTAPAAARVPKPHAYPAGESSPGAVTFRHETHMRGGAACAACHVKPFRMKFSVPPPGTGMHDACGTCHNGARTFGTDDPETCARCHSGAQP